MSTRTDLAPDRLLSVFDQIEDLAERYDIDHRLRHNPCTCTRPTLREWWTHIARDFREAFTADDDEEVMVPEIPDNLSKDQKHRLRKKYGVTRQYSSRT